MLKLNLMPLSVLWISCSVLQTVAAHPGSHTELTVPQLQSHLLAGHLTPFLWVGGLLSAAVIIQRLYSGRKDQ